MPSIGHQYSANSMPPECLQATCRTLLNYLADHETECYLAIVSSAPGPILISFLFHLVEYFQVYPIFHLLSLVLVYLLYLVQVHYLLCLFPDPILLPLVLILLSFLVCRLIPQLKKKYNHVLFYFTYLSYQFVNN